MNRKHISAFLFALLLMCSLFPLYTYADDFDGVGAGCTTVQDENGSILFTWAGKVYADDEYISEDNKLYRIVEVDAAAGRAIARFIEQVSLDTPAKERSVFARAEKADTRIAIYCTHDDESYVQGDGSESVQEGGGILDVAEELQKKLQAQGFDVAFSDESHVPHDAGSYRRSRKTAVALMQQEMPVALLDIHRDGIPDAAEYEKDFDGVQASRIRLVVGRSNQNKAANENFARDIKAAADKLYPGLVKDIFMGKGSYNQDLMPQSLIIEMGTHTIDKDRVMNTTQMVADVLARALNGPGEPVQGNKSETKTQQQSGAISPKKQSGTMENAPKKADTQKNQAKSAATGIAWIIGVTLAVGLIFLVVAMNSGGRMKRVGDFFRELTGTGKRGGEQR